MQIRREQGLLIAAALLGVWIWSGMKPEASSTRVSPDRKDYAPEPLPADPIVPPLASPEIAGRDAFLEPTESSPLPPRVLPFPELGSLPVVVVPLVPGQQPPAYYQLRVPGGVVEEFQFAGAQDEGQGPPSAPAGAGAPLAVGNGGGQGSEGSQYDRVFTTTQTEPFYGFIRQPDKYTLVGKRAGGFTEPIVLEWINKKTGVVVRREHPIEVDEIQRIELADTLSNQIELRRRGLGRGVASLKSRRKFIDDLLRDARKEPWVYQIAEEQAAEYAQISANPEDRYLPMALVLRDRGDMSREWKLYSGLQKELGDTAFLQTAMGSFKARLGLDIEAEQHLRKARAEHPQDPLSALVLARFLLQRGRAGEALEFVEAARRNRHALGEEEQFAAWATWAAVHLAVGDRQAAKTALTDLPIGGEFAVRRELLKASIEYADRDSDAARGLFASAVAASAMGQAALGLASCDLLDKRWAEAEAGFKAVAVQHPLLRHRALAGLGLLYERTGHAEVALEVLESAARANPEDPYVLYLLGRQRRLSGQIESAIEALEGALAQSDQFVEAHAELAVAHLQHAESGGADVIEALDRARRYADRVVELDAARGDEVTYRVLQGVVHFRSGYNRGAREAFAAGASRSLRCRIGQALVEYAQNHVAEARGQLTEIKTQLRSGDPVRDYIEQTVALIDDHAEKEELLDHFERDQLGRQWEQVERDGTVTPTPADGELRFRGRLATSGHPVFAKRIQPTAGKFLRAEVSLKLGAGDQSKSALLELSTGAAQRSTGRDFAARIGFRDKVPYLIILDGDPGRARDAEEARQWDPVELPTPDADPSTFHRLMFEVLPREEGARFTLRAYWDGELVHERPVERLNRNARGQMTVGLVVQGTKGAEVDVSFDDFRLVRRREGP